MTNVENYRFDAVMGLIQTQKPPHRCTFKRYDYKLDPFTLVWIPLPELRDQGVYIEDPRIARVAFVDACAAGDLAAVKLGIAQGEDVNAYDYAQVSAIQAAAVNSRAEIVTLLKNCGANINSRDKNNITPLLACIRRGVVDMVRMLLDYHADRTVTDNLNRGVLFYAVGKCILLYL